MADNWFYAKGGEKFGPYSEADMERMIAEGSVTASTNLWREGMENWKKAVETELAGLFSDIPAVPADDNGVCLICKKEFPASELVDIDGAKVCADCKPQMLRRLQEGGSALPQLRYGGFWIRVCACIVDGIVLQLIQLPITIINGVVVASNPDSMAASLSQIVATLLGLVIGVLYYALFVWKKSATPGKMVFGLKIINADGSDGISLGKAVGRYFACLLSGLLVGVGYLMVAFDDRKRGLHDRICETLVVYK